VTIHESGEKSNGVVMGGRNSAIVLHEKCENIVHMIEDESVDLIYTDPPYGMKYKSNIPGDRRWNKSGNTANKFVSTMHGDTPSSLNWDFLAGEMYRILKHNAFLFLHSNMIMIGNLYGTFLSKGFIHKGVVVWRKKNGIGGDLTASMKRDWEPLWYLTKGKPSFNPISVIRGNGITKNTVMRNRISETDDWVFPLLKSEQLGHPTQKPIALARQVIELCTNEGDLIVDPFAGSGTIPAACILLKRDCIAIEKTRMFYQLAKKRVKDVLREELRNE